jgi:glycosyltransferase involved in cell wall biosynthesis
LSSEGVRFEEVVVLDNGSAPEDLAELALLEARFPGRVRVLALGADRYFGEAANIGVEAVEADLVLLMRDGVRPAPDCVGRLVAVVLERPRTALAGPVLVDEAGRVVSAGALVDSGGATALLEIESPPVSGGADGEGRPRFVPEACLLLRRRAFVEVGGFDLRWEPGPYEDADLCLELLSRGWAVEVVPSARAETRAATEPGTSGSSDWLVSPSVAPAGQLERLLVGRVAFADKWQEWIRAVPAQGPPGPPCRPGSATETAATPPAPAVARVPLGGLGSAMIYDPYDLVPGGGERVVFDIASTLGHVLGHDAVALVVPRPCSRLRLDQVRRALDLEGPRTLVLHDRAVAARPDLSIVLGNDVVPPVAGFGTRRNVYLCQFPCQVAPGQLEERIGHMATFDEIWVNSQFVRRYVNGQLRLLGLQPPPVRVIHPPASADRSVDLPEWAERRGVVCVGRFFTGAHDKRHDVVIDVVRLLEEQYGRRVPLSLAGSLHPDPASRDRFVELQARAEGLDCRFHPNATRARILELYRTSAVLVHATGFGVDPLGRPERLEHFGIVPVEAASSGCIPVVVGHGGPAEAMAVLGGDTTFETIPEAAALIDGLLGDPVGAAETSARLRERSAVFSQEAFRQRILGALSGA